MKKYIFILILLLTLGSCGGGDDSDDFIGGVNLSEEIIEVSQLLDKATFKGGKTLSFDAAVGSGAFHAKGDPVDEFYTVLDRGPVIACSETETVLEVKDFCMNNGQVDNAGTIFPLADKFSPSIYKLNIDTSGVFGTKAGYSVTQTIKLSDRDGHALSGLPNPLQLATTENAYDNNGNRLEFDPEGIDPEAIVSLSNGSFWIAEEYAPSLVHITANGRVLERVVPAGMENDLAAANYRVLGLLPAILKKRQWQRGIEGLAISPDGNFLYFIVQSPLANPDPETFKKSRYVRLFKASLNNYDLEKIVGEYVYVLDEPATFTGDNTTEPSDVKISELVMLDSGKLIVLERVTRHTKFYQIASLDDATNILGTEWDDELKLPPSLENVASLTAQGITPVNKKLVVDSRRDISDLDFDIEALAVLNGDYAVLVNDNESAVKGVLTRFHVKEIAKKLDQQ